MGREEDRTEKECIIINSVGHDSNTCKYCTIIFKIT